MLELVCRNEFYDGSDIARLGRNIMKVREIMTGNVQTCDLNGSLAEAAKQMWDNDCGILPVLKDGREVVGVITDRDICMGTMMRDRNPSAISVEEVITGEVYSVKPEDNIDSALQVMQKHKVRRLPILDEEEGLRGLLSMNDVVLQAQVTEGKKTPPLSYADVVTTYKAISEHRAPMAATAAASSD